MKLFHRRPQIATVVANLEISKAMVEEILENHAKMQERLQRPAGTRPGPFWFSLDAAVADVLADYGPIGTIHFEGLGALLNDPDSGELRWALKKCAATDLPLGFETEDACQRYAIATHRDFTVGVCIESPTFAWTRYEALSLP